MAWDFYIWAIPFETAKKENITIQSLNKQNWEVFEEKGFIELVSYRSKQVCFAMQQMVGYFDDGFSWDSDVHLFDMQDASMLLNFEEAIKLLDWLIVVAYFLEDGYTTEEYAPILQNLLPFLDGSEFEHFAVCAYMFESWKKEVNKHSNSLFYWHNSF
jgi:hypothetical protein